MHYDDCIAVSMASGNVNGNAAPEGPVRISHDEILHAHADDPPDATVADEAPATAIPASLRPPTAPISGVGQTIAQVGPNRALENGSDCWKRKSVLTLGMIAMIAVCRLYSANER